MNQYFFISFLFFVYFTQNYRSVFVYLCLHKNNVLYWWDALEFSCFPWQHNFPIKYYGCRSRHIYLIALSVPPDL